MDSGFKILLVGIVLIVLVFTAMSVWPILSSGPASQQWLQQGTAQPTPNQALTPQNAPGQPSPAQPGPPPSQPLAQQPPPQQATPGPSSHQPEQALEMGTTNWMYTRRNVILLKEPDGFPLQPFSLNKAPLKVLKGCRLEPLETEGEWVMVKSLADVIGWVKSNELTAQAPPEIERVWRY